jgi:hypothetical protein
MHQLIIAQTHHQLRLLIPSEELIDRWHVSSACIVSASGLVVFVSLLCMSFASTNGEHGREGLSRIIVIALYGRYPLCQLHRCFPSFTIQFLLHVVLPQRLGRQWRCELLGSSLQGAISSLKENTIAMVFILQA